MFTISGSVFDEQTQNPLSEAVVKITAAGGTKKITETNDRGEFFFTDVPAGECQFAVFKEDYYLAKTYKRKLSSNRKDLKIPLAPGGPLDLNASEFANLAKAAYLITNDNRKELGLDIPLAVYVQDPLVAEEVKTENALLKSREDWDPIQTIFVSCEPGIMAGPTSSRLAVVDYDADKNHLETPVEWDDQERYFSFKYKGKKVRLTQEHREEPQFHQVNVWAIVQSILDMYEQTWILGRSAPWGFDGNRLILVPHAGQTRNAYYDRLSKSIQFYYFTSRGKKVYTCLSHDIIAHETGHAILDGLRPYYLEPSSLQTAAFHEFIADLTAILAALLNNELRWEVAKDTEGDLSKDKIISSLAEEFGFYSYGRPYLRTAQDPRKLVEVQDETSQYEWSQVLTGAMFDILKEFVAIRKATPRSDGRFLTIKEALMLATNRFRRVAFQPLDYLPPADVQFDDYVRAVLRADEIVDPLDENGYRAAMIEVFKKRGFHLEEDDNPQRLGFYAYGIDRISRSRTDAYHFLNENRRQLCIPMDQDVSVVDLYQTDKTVMGGARLPREIVIQYLWREDIHLKGADYGVLDGEYVPLYCGGTLVFDSRGNVLSWQRKPGTGNMEIGNRLRDRCRGEVEKGMRRQMQLLEYYKNLVASGALGLEGKDRPDAVGLQPPMVTKRASDGSLRLQGTPYLRHWNEK
jgi:hypothetical protein